MSIEHIRLSKQAREQLITLKRRTGIEHWNVLCRWAFCVSLAEPSLPPNANHPADSNVEMSWKVFGGPHANLYWILLKERCLRDRLEIGEENLAHMFRLHLHRGIAYLVGNPDLRTIRELISLALPNLGDRGAMTNSFTATDT